MKKDKTNEWKEFFGITKWKIILTIVAWLTFGFIVGWEECALFIEGNIVCTERYFLGIKDPNLLMVLSFIFFYLIFSTIIFLINKLKGGKEKNEK